MEIMKIKMSKVLVTGLMICFLGSFVLAKTDNEPVQILKKALLLQNEKDYQGAWQLLKDVLDNATKEEIAFAATMQLGNLYKELKKPRAALISYRNAYNVGSPNESQRNYINEETLKMLSLYMVDRTEELKDMLIYLAKLRHASTIYPVPMDSLPDNPWFSNSIGVTGLTVMRHHDYPDEDGEFSGKPREQGKKPDSLKIFDHDFPSVTRLIQGTNSRDPWVRQTCMYILGKTATEESKTPIIETLGSYLQTPPSYWLKQDMNNAKMVLLRLGESAKQEVKKIKIASDESGELESIYNLLMKPPYSKKNGMIQGQILCYSRQLGLLDSQVLEREIDLEIFKSAKGPRTTPLEPLETIKTDEQGRFQIEVTPGFYRVSLQNSPDAFGEEITNVEVLPGKYTVVLPASYLCETRKKNQP